MQGHIHSLHEHVHCDVGAKTLFAGNIETENARSPFSVGDGVICGYSTKSKRTVSGKGKSNVSAVVKNA
jgi:hypothetical protein